MTDCIQVVTTTQHKADAEKIAQTLVARRLAACIQVLGPITSTYWWQGKIETAEEWLCVAKSSRARWDDLEKAIRELHPYEVPEILAVPVVAGSAGYLEWLRRELSGE
ncbi:MAG: divalent-cation tolerance protein CutA [Pirellulales bacterium]|jgi:periplasmic divalent cation tolerance protein